MSEAEKRVKEEQVGIASVWLKLDISRDVSDFANRLSFKFTVAFILCYCGFATLWILFFDTELSYIRCWVPQHFKKGWRNYTNRYCLVHNTYIAPLDDDSRFPMDDVSKQRNKVLHYQWHMMLLLLQATFFSLPHYFWCWAMSKARIDLASLHDEVKAKAMYGTSHSAKQARAVAYYFDRFVSASPSTSRLSYLSRRGSSFLCLSVIVTKLLYICNLIGQLYFMSVLFFPRFPHFHTWDDVWAGFPVVTFCDLPVRRLGNVHSYTLQCVLPNNYFRSRYFFALYVWLFIVLAVSVWSLFAWLTWIVMSKHRVRFIKARLRTKVEYCHKKTVGDFTREYLTRDGALALRLLYQNTKRVLLMEDVIELLWEKYTSRDFN